MWGLGSGGGEVGIWMGASWGLVSGSGVLVFLSFLSFLAFFFSFLSLFFFFFFGSLLVISSA